MHPISVVFLVIAVLWFLWRVRAARRDAEPLRGVGVVAALLLAPLMLLVCHAAAAQSGVTPTSQLTLTRPMAPDSALHSPIRPDPARTPGATLPVTKADICVSGYSKKVRNVPEAVKRQAYASYGITSRKPGEYEIDHLISLELGGSNSIKNLWPEKFDIDVGGKNEGAHSKDALENRLHALVCAGALTLVQAQTAIRADWLVSYRKYVSPSFPVSR